jgi:hypothetical protein
MPRIHVPGGYQTAREMWDTIAQETQPDHQPIRPRARVRDREAQERRAAERRKARRPERAPRGARPAKE